MIIKRWKSSRFGEVVRTLCPFHNEKNPSFDIYVEKGSFRCWGCGKQGSLDKLKIFLPEIFQYLGPLPLIPSPPAPLTDTVFPLMAGGQDIILKKFFAERKIFRVDGPVFRKGKWVCFPTERSLHMRHIEKKEFRQKGPIWFYPSLNQNKKKYIILVEGVLDALYLRQYGLNAVAILGKRLPAVEPLLQFKEVVFFFDPDAYKSAVKEAKKLLFYIPSVRVIPSKKDPDEYSLSELIDILDYLRLENL